VAETSVAALSGTTEADLLQMPKIGQISRASVDVTFGQVSADGQTAPEARTQRRRKKGIRRGDLRGGPPASIAGSCVGQNGRRDLDEAAAWPPVDNPEIPEPHTRGGSRDEFWRRTRKPRMDGRDPGNQDSRQTHIDTLDLSLKEYLKFRQVFKWIVPPPDQATEAGAEATSTYIKHHATKTVPRMRQGSSRHSKDAPLTRAAITPRPGSSISSEGTYVTAFPTPELTPTHPRLPSDSFLEKGPAMSFNDDHQTRRLPGSFPTSVSVADSGAPSRSANEADRRYIKNDRSPNVSVRRQPRSSSGSIKAAATTRPEQSRLRFWWGM